MRQSLGIAVTTSLCAVALLCSRSAVAQPDGAPRAFTALDLVTLDRVSDPQLSPDGRRVAYDLRSTDYAANRGRHALWLLDLSGAGAPVRLVAGATNARWAPNGRSIYFLSSKSGSQQVWRTNASGAPPVAVTKLPLDVQTFRISPDGKHLVVALSVFPDCVNVACTAERLAKRAKNKNSGTVYTSLFVRHWDTWNDGTKNHLFAMTLAGDGTAPGPATSLMGSFDGDSPSKPFGGDADFTIAPDSDSVVFSARLAGTSEPWSTNFDLWRAPMNGSARPENITADNLAWDGTPAFSPDGTRLAYLAQKRPGFESDRFGIMLRDLRSNRTTELAPAWDRSAQTLTWSSDGRRLYVTAEDAGDARLYEVDAASGAVRPLTGAGTVDGVAPGARDIVYARSALDSPAQLFRMAAAGGEPMQLTHADATMLRGVVFSPSERFTFEGWNGDKVQGIVTRPFGYRAGHKYPVAFLIHGGPQGSFGDGWSYRWNPQTYAGRGYAVVTIDFHGSTGYGQAFTDAISQHWGDRPLEDLQKGWSAALARYPYLDGNRACALGASYGGFMVDWIAGNWQAPWKCLVSHDGVFDNRMMGYSTEELWFSEWENGGVPWEHPENYERFNPVDHVASWSVPMLIVHSEHDYRIPLDQGIGAFTTLQRRGIPSEFLTFPDENHWVLKPQNSLQWHDAVEDWLAHWTG